MAPTVEMVPPSVARAQLLASLGLSAAVGDRIVCLELVRAMTWALTGATRAAHVLRIVSRCLPPAMAVFQGGDSVREDLRAALEALADAGDLVELARGHWLPAPSRLVSLGAGRGHLLVGGVPTRALGKLGDGALEFNGPFRRVRDAAALTQLGLPSEPLSEWARLPAQPLVDWAAEFARTPLAAYEGPTEEGAFQLYTPELSAPGAPQFKRWRERAAGLPDGRRLARRQRVFGAREHRLVDVARGEVVRSGSVLAAGEARRLMYALDGQAKNPVVAELHEAAGALEVTLRSELPGPEQRLFAALGALYVPEERPYERRWRFRGDSMLVRERLTALGITLKPPKRGWTT